MGPYNGQDERPVTWVDVLRWRIGDAVQRVRDELYDLWSLKLNPHPHCVYCLTQFWTFKPWREFYCPHPNCQAERELDGFVNDLAEISGCSTREVRQLVLGALAEFPEHRPPTKER